MYPMDREMLDGVVAATPADRDRYVDFLRAFSILTVVVGHWLVALIHWENGKIYVENAVGHQSGLWIATWVLQVMPVFFFVGGFSNLRGWRSTRERSGSYVAFLQRRLERLLRPTLVFAAVWIVVEFVLHVGDIGAPGLTRGTFLPFGPLWFLAVYIVIVAVTPLTVAAHARWGIAVPVLLAGAVGLVDLGRHALGWPAGLGWINLLTVWLFAHQLGYFYGDGSLTKGGTRVHVALTGLGLAGMIVLTNLVSFTDRLLYPRSMVGVDIERVSNMSPPSMAIVFLALFQVGLAMAIRPWVAAWLDRPAPWRRVVAVNSVIMTLFLWHLTGLVVAILALYPLGLGRPTTASLGWWVQRPIWVVAPGVVTAALVAVFGRFERPRTRKSPGARRGSMR
jgi:hypothetical protein